MPAGSSPSDTVALPPRPVAAGWSALEGWTDDDLREALPALRA